MSRIRIIFIIISLLSSGFIFLGQWSVFAGWNWSIFDREDTTIHLCNNGECTLDNALKAVKDSNTDLVTEKTATQFIVDVVLYILSFVTLVAVIYIIYAGFMLLISSGDEKKLESTKKIILSVVLGILVMWIAYALVSLILNALNRVVFSPFVTETYAAEMQYTESDAGTFAEYQKKLNEMAIDIELEYRQNNNTISQSTLDRLKVLADQAYTTLPDSAKYESTNKQAKQWLDLYISLAEKNPSLQSRIADLVGAIQNFTSKSMIDRIQGSITANPNAGSAPLTVSFSAQGVVDPSWTQIPVQNYIWWMREPTGRREIGRGQNLVYTFSRDQIYTVNLDITSESRNKKGKISVLPFSQSIQVDVKPRIGTIYFFINGVDVTNLKTFKITPWVWAWGIILDATASRSTEGTTIEKTNWKFWNGNNDLSYGWPPQIERQIFANKWKYELSLELLNNQWNTFRKDLTLIVQESNATISVDKTTGYIGENFNFIAESFFGTSMNILYYWDVKDANTGKSIASGEGISFPYTFKWVGTYIVTLVARPPNGISDADSRTITIASRDPFVSFDINTLDTSRPNTITLNALASYDADTRTNEWLTYSWQIDSMDVKLNDPKKNGAQWTYTFDTIGDHPVTLTVVNKYGKVATLTKTVTINSLLSVSLTSQPKVATIGSPFSFTVDAPEAIYYEWDFGDNSGIEHGTNTSPTHTYFQWGKYTVSLTVSDQNGNSNRTQTAVYVANSDEPLAVIQVKNGNTPIEEAQNVCNGEPWYRINRAWSVTFDGSQSINVDGSQNGLLYTWKYQNRTETTSMFSRRFDELGCFPLSLTIKNAWDGSIHTQTLFLSVENLPPTLTAVSAVPQNNSKDTQKLIVDVSADGAWDPDGVITSYVWYYYTEWNPEAQDVRITQTPRTTFVLPNITEKYYFTVILEDNNGARVKSDDVLKEKIPLITSNDDGNVNIPLVTLSTSNSHINVGESVRFNVSARTILGKDVTSTATYAWDFDGDGVIDRKWSNPEEVYVYNTQGNYQMKVKVTSNGVTNSKFQQVVVDNVLEPSTMVYRMGSRVFAINTSLGKYTTTKWTIGDYFSENPDYALYDFWSLENLPAGWTLTIWDWINETYTTFALLEWVEYVPNSQGISYLTYPEAVNDIVTVWYPGQKVMLALWMNPWNRYSIDTNTAIDTDLDGVPDNDEDNKWTDSYNNGAPFFISRGERPLARKQNVKITIYESGKIVGTKMITLIFPFISESPSTWTWEYSSGSDTGTDGRTMTAWDRALISRLDFLIRSAPQSVQEMLRPKYNLLLDNWIDSTEKARIIIEMKEIISTSGLDASTTTDFMNVLDQILGEDLQSMTEIDSAIRAIEWLVAQSMNSGSIMESLNQIRSHPTNLELNKQIGTSILEIVKNDKSLSDEYKLMLKQQLSGIILGDRNIPPPTSSETGESGFVSLLLAFILGFLQVIFWILIVVSILFGFAYIYYKKVNTHPEIGFQDFIIDRIFHHGASKKELPHTPPLPHPPVSPSIPVVSGEEKQENVHISTNSYQLSPTLPDTWVNPTPPETSLPQPPESGKVPSWLLEYDQEHPDNMTTPMPPSETSSSVPESPIPPVSPIDIPQSIDPLSTALQADPLTTSPPTVAEVKQGNGNLPPWITDIDEEKIDSEVSDILENDTKDLPDIWIPAHSENPWWENTPSSESTGITEETISPLSPSQSPEPNSTSHSGRSDDWLPDWLRGDVPDMSTSDTSFARDVTPGWEEGFETIHEGETGEETIWDINPDNKPTNTWSQRDGSIPPSTDKEEWIESTNLPTEVNTPLMSESSEKIEPENGVEDTLPEWLRHAATQTGKPSRSQSISPPELISETQEVFPQSPSSHSISQSEIWEKQSTKKRQKRKRSPTNSVLSPSPHPSSEKKLKSSPKWQKHIKTPLPPPRSDDIPSWMQ